MTPCEINVAYFPFDVTHCTIIIASYGHTASSIMYSWDEKGVVLNPENLDDNGFQYLYAYLTKRVSAIWSAIVGTPRLILFTELLLIGPSKRLKGP